MPKNITNVEWNAENIPSGVSFDTSTGTFSGEVGAEGEYTVPVTVTTNYGTDTKDVKFTVEGKSYPVYAIGKYAATWSGNATPNDSGFRKLPMPNTKRLATLYNSFGAKISTRKWYVCGNNAKYFGLTDGSVSTSQPLELPIEDIAEMIGGYTHRSDSAGSNTAYFMYRTFGNLMRWVTASLTTSTYTSSSVREGILKIQANFGDGIIYQDVDEKITIHDAATVNGSYYTPNKPVKILIKQGLGDIFYLTMDGELWRVTEGTAEQIGSELGAIRDVWIFPSAASSINSTYPPSLFAQSASDGKLYAMGGNTTYQLGLPEAKYYTEFTEVGDYDAKKIDYRFMLTTDGKLYHTGNAISGITSIHTGGYAQIFSELKFKDISYNSTSQTLVVLLDDGSTDEEPASTEPTEYQYNYIYLHNDDANTRSIDLHEYLQSWSSNAGICLQDAGINSVSYAWCFWDGFKGRYVEDGDTQIISSVNNAVATYDISTGRIIITKAGDYTNSGGEASTYILKITTNKSTEIFHITIYKNAQSSMDETLVTGTEQYPY